MSLSDLYRKDFNIFNAPQNKGVIYLDNAATTHRPQCVIDAISNFYNNDNANPLRGLYGLSVRATDDYENSRAVVGAFIGSACGTGASTNSMTSSSNTMSSSANLGDE